MTRFQRPDVAAIYAGYPPKIRRQLLMLRDLVFATAAATQAGEIEECLKWGEPAYLTRDKSGTTLRLAWSAKRPRQFGLYVNCQTDLIGTFRQLFATDFTYDGNRGIIFQEGEDLPRDKLATCIAAALAYHRRKR